MSLWLVAQISADSYGALSSNHAVDGLSNECVLYLPSRAWVQHLKSKFYR